MLLPAERNGAHEETAGWRLFSLEPIAWNASRRPLAHSRREGRGCGIMFSVKGLFRSQLQVMGCRAFQATDTFRAIHLFDRMYSDGARLHA